MLNITSLGNSDIECFEVAPGNVIHGAVSEWNVIFLDLRDNFDSITTLELNREDKIESRPNQLRHQNSVTGWGNQSGLNGKTTRLKKKPHPILI